jgi:hypothetical protein
MNSRPATLTRARCAILCVVVVLCLAPCSLFAQTPKLTTHPSPPPANQPFDGELWILTFPDAIGPTPSSPTTASDGYILFNYDTCHPCAYNTLAYRRFPLHFPALTAGMYDVRFWQLLPVDVDPPPTVADFSLKVVAGPSSVPSTSVPALMSIGLLLITLAWRNLSKRNADTGL